MVTDLDKLIELQSLDDQLAHMEEEQAAMPGQREAFAQQRVECDQRVEAAGEAVRAAEGEQRRLEVELADQQTALQRLESQQFQVKSNDAYTVLLQEMERAKQSISDCETGILECMETIEAAGASLAEAESEAGAVRSRLDDEAKALDARELELRTELTALRSQRERLAGDVDAPLLSLYTRISKRRSPAIAMVSGELCQGCRVNIPPQSYIEILKGEKIITCGNCTRILIHEPPEESGPEATVAS
jgi:predicted  nucleic acid-binding Zn-ribbon protein